MVPRRTSHKLFSLIAGLFFTGIVIVLCWLVPSVSSRTARLEHDLDQRFLAYESLKLDTRSVLQQVQDTGRLSLTTSDLSFNLELVPHDLRAQGYRAEVFGADGAGRTINIGPVKTYRGRARGTQNGAQLPQLGEARFTIDEAQIVGLIITPTEHYFVEPAQNFSDAATTSDYVIYRESSVLTSSSGECGVTLSEQVQDKATTINGSQNLTQAGAAAALQEIRVATEADFEYVESQPEPAMAIDRILSILNQVEGLYEFDLGLTIKVVYQSAWATPNDPYTATNSSSLLSELTNHWNNNRGSVARDVVHLWTGKQLDNSTIGTAYLEALCRYSGNGRAAYGLSKGIDNDVQQVAITAHEIGHNLGATHPNQQIPPVAECANTVMGSSIGTSPQLSFCQFSQEEIARYLSTSANCLGEGTTHLKFAVANQTPAGTVPAAIASADFNGDGKDDVVVASRDNNDFSVLVGTDTGTFQLLGTQPVGQTPHSIVAADFNLDGKQDVAVGTDDMVKLFPGTGTGSFQTPVNVAAGTAPFSITVTDFNSDGKKDLVVINGGTQNLSVLLGTGTGTFEPPITAPAGTNPMGLAVGDFNGDGRSDVAVMNRVGEKGNFVKVLLGTGSGSLQPLIDLVILLVPNAIGVGDFNDDNKLDIAVAGTDPISLIPGKVLVRTGNGDGTFQSPGANVPAGSRMSSPTSLTVGDFNADGQDDMAMNLEGMVSIILGGHLDSPTLYQAGLSPVASAMGDYDGDGKEDLAVANQVGNDVGLLLGTGSGSFQAVLNFFTDANPNWVTVGEFNHDGKADLAVANMPGTISTLLGQGTGNFDGAVNSSIGLNAMAVAAADLNNDGHQDLIASGINVFLGSGNGFFQAPVKYPTSSIASAIVIADVNVDGNLDVITNFDLFLGNGDGSLQPRVSIPSSGIALAVGKLDGDNFPDLVVRGSGLSSIEVHLGNGNGTFQPGIEYATGSDPESIAIADFNGDAKSDLAVANFGDSTVSILLGTGTGSFQPAVNSPAGNGAFSLAVGDFDRDNKQDLAVVPFLTSSETVLVHNTFSILLGTGVGTFRPPVNLAVGDAPVSVAVGDFNNDLNPDLAIAHAGQNISVVLNISGQLLSGVVNDNFVNARVITGATGTLPGTNIQATREVNEPNHLDGTPGTVGSSIWYRWRAPSTGKFYFQTFSSSFPNVLAVYTGTSVAALTNVVRSTTAVPEYVEFDATAGTTYHIAIDGLTGDTGRTVLSWNTGSLSNDNFAFAREIRGSSGSVNGNNTGFTLEPSEPTLPGASSAFSAWYRWTAPNTGKVSFLATPLAPTACGDTTRLLGAYSGNFIDILTPVAVNFDGYRDFDDPGACDNRTLRFNAVAGTTYRIQLRSGTGKPFTLSWNYADPPPNDNFANALILAGASGSLVGSNRDATKEAGEPNHAAGPGGASIWYRWTAPTTGPVTFDTIGFRNQTANSFRYLTALLAVYTGSSLNTLTAVATNATDNKVTFNATAGTTYQIAVDSAPYSGGGYLPGIVPLHWGAKQVANDDFVNAQPLTASGSFVPLLSSNAGATKETGEPNHQGHNGGPSVWYRWTALSTGNISFVLNPCSTCSLSTSNTLVAVYTGASVNALTPVPSTADNNHSFAAVRGTTYFIAVDSRSTGGSFELSLVSANISARNDAFATAQVLSGSAGAVAGDNSGASRELVEPNHANDIGGASVWYQWKAPASGLYTFDTFGSNFDTLLAVYTGNVVSALTVVASSDNAGSSAQSRLTFDAKLNTTYFIAVDGKSNGVEAGTGLARSQAGFILLNWNNLPPPVNDNFANAQLLSGASGNVSGRNTVASKEGGEPNHAGSPGGVSVWYQWTAPTSGNFTFNTFGSDCNTLLAVYTGNTLTALAAVSSNDDVGGLRQSRVTFNATAATVYYLAVDGSAGVPGNVTAFSGNVVLSWFPETGVSNDNFLLAQPLNGASGSLAATNAGATKETGEPNHAADRGGRSLWYSWTAPFTGPVLFTTAGSDFDTLLAIYSGADFNQLTALASNDDSPYPDNLGHILTSSLSFHATAGTTYRIAVDGSGGRFGNFALRWGPDAKISGQVSFIGGVCGSDKKVTLLLSGEDTRAITFTGSGTYTFQHLRVGGNYSVRGVSEISASCLPLFLERARNAFPLAGELLDANFFDDGLRGGGSTSNITGHVQNATGVGLHNVALALTGAAARTVYTDNAGLYLLPNLPAGTYQVTPSKAGAVFTPAVREFTFTSGQTITDADFVTQESFNLSGQSRALNGAPLSAVTITLNNGTQPVSQQQTDANGYYSFDAAAGGSYTLTATKAGLSFAPAAQSILPLNENRKNLDFTVTQTQTLTVTSVNPNSGVNISIAPTDRNNLANGATQFTRTYDLNTTVNLTAPVTVNGNVFQKWLKDGVDYSTSVATSVLLDTDHTLTAVYLTTTAQTPAGQNVAVQLNNVKVTFTTVTVAGTTTITPINPATAGQLPNGYQLTGDSVAFDISTSATFQPPISVCFNLPALTDAAVFAQLRLLHHENGVLVDRTATQDFSNKLICANVNSLSPFVLASSTVPLLQLLLEDSSTTQAAALDAVLLVRDPFPVVNPGNLLNPGSDQNTRVLVFLKNLQLQAGESAAVVTVNLVDSSGRSYDVVAESLWALPSFEFSQLSFRLPDGLAQGPCTVQIRAHGQVSNVGVIRIKL